MPAIIVKNWEKKESIMKKRSAFYFLLFILAAFCIPSSAFAEAPGISKDTIIVGGIVDKAGPVARDLSLQTMGARAYFQKAFDEGLIKRKIKVVTEDGGYDPAKHLSAGKLLLDRDGVFCLISAVGTAPSLALNTLLESRKVPLIGMSAQSSRLSVPFHKYIFSQMCASRDQARICVDAILKENPKARIAMICQDDAFGFDGRDGFLEQCKKYGVKPAGVVTFRRGTKDFSSPVLKLKSLNPDWVINHTVAVYGASILKEAQKLGWKPRWMVMSGLLSRQFIQLSGPAIKFAGDVRGVMINYPPDGDTPAAVEYRAAMKKYQPEADVNDANSMWGYGRAKVFVEGLKRAEAANDLSREGLIKSLETLRDFKTGVYAPITYTSKSHAAPKSCLLVKVQGPTYVAISNEWMTAK